ncbi:MAG: hypothetical protein RIQ94_1149 [Pseudomonadota bacterium]
MSHDFHNSHDRKVNDNPNFLINSDGSVTQFYRDMSDKIDIKNIVDKHAHGLLLAQSDYKGHHPRAMKSNTNIQYSGIITFGNNDNVLSRLEIDSKDQCLLDANALKFLQDFAKENGIDINSMYLAKHCDESMIHYHFKFIAYDHAQHEVMRSRMNPEFMSGLQDLAGECFEPSGFVRGIKKIDRIEDVLIRKGLTRGDYLAMSPGEKLIIMKEANVKNKAPRALHTELKNKVYELQQSLDKSLTLFDLVQKSTPSELKKIKEEIDDSDDKIIKRFFAYALRLHNAAADKLKAVRNLEETIKKLGERKTEIEETFRRFALNTNAARMPRLGLLSDNDSDIKIKGKTLPGGGYIVIKTRDLDKLESDAVALRDSYLKLHAEHIEQAQAIAPFAKDIATLQQRLAQSQSDEQHEKRLAAIASALENGLKRANGDEELVKIVTQKHTNDSKKLLDDVRSIRM